MVTFLFRVAVRDVMGTLNVILFAAFVLSPGCLRENVDFGSSFATITDPRTWSIGFGTTF